MVERDRRRVEFGDWQTPRGLADEVVRLLTARGPEPRTVLEPSCGRGAFLVSVSEAHPRARLIGFDISANHLSFAREALGSKAELVEADFFSVDWAEVVAELEPPILVLGNPPWVTNSALGALGAHNLPEKRGLGEGGLDSLTGKSNFDISEWMLWRLVSALEKKEFCLAMLCKASVARRVVRRIASAGLPLAGSFHNIDARAHFMASVDAVLLRLQPRGVDEDTSWPLFASLSDTSAKTHMGVIGERLIGDLAAFGRTRDLEGKPRGEWRSGLKHDCAEVMELRLEDGVLRNKRGEPVEIENEYVFPLLKSSDLAKGRVETSRRVLVPQARLGEDTNEIRERAPKTWAYLLRHQARFDARKSRIYRGRPAFSLFGVGAYSFEPHKVAVSGLYPTPCFNSLAPVDGRPVMLDDTCYFLPCPSEESASSLARDLNGERAREFFRARMFTDSKRPLNKALLQTLNLDALSAECR